MIMTTDSTIDDRTAQIQPVLGMQFLYQVHDDGRR